MTNQEIQELAKIYGIEINDVEEGTGGLFYGESDGHKKFLKDIFGVGDGYAVAKNESISLKKCGTYSVYKGIAFLMSDAA